MKKIINFIMSFFYKYVILDYRTHKIIKYSNTASKVNFCTVWDNDTMYTGYIVKLK